MIRAFLPSQRQQHLIQLHQLRCNMKKTRPPPNAIIIVMAGLDPAIHASGAVRKQDVDGPEQARA
jgi:hypothetical protein